MIFLLILNFIIMKDMQDDGSTQEIHSTASTGSSAYVNRMCQIGINMWGTVKHRKFEIC